MGSRGTIGIVVPTIEAATGIGDEDGLATNKTIQPIAVFATRRTVETDCYPRDP
jgi:glutamate racemase